MLSSPLHDEEDLGIDIDVDVTEEVDLARTRELQRAFLQSSSGDVRMTAPPRRSGGGGARYRAMSPPPPAHRRAANGSPAAFNEPPVPGAPMPVSDPQSGDITNFPAGSEPPFPGTELGLDDVPSVAELSGDLWGDLGEGDAELAVPAPPCVSATETKELPALSVSDELNYGDVGESVDDLAILGFQDPSLGGSLSGGEPLSFDVHRGVAPAAPVGLAAVVSGLAESGEVTGSFDDDTDDILFGVRPTSALSPMSVRRPISSNDVTLPGFSSSSQPALSQRDGEPHQGSSVHSKATDELMTTQGYPPGAAVSDSMNAHDELAQQGGLHSAAAPESESRDGAKGGGHSRAMPENFMQHRPPLSRPTKSHHAESEGSRSKILSRNKRTSRQMSGPRRAVTHENMEVVKGRSARPRKNLTPNAPPVPSNNTMAKTAAALKMVASGAEIGPLPGSESSVAPVKPPLGGSSPSRSARGASASSSHVEFNAAQLSDDPKVLMGQAQRLRRAKQYARAHVVLKHLLKIVPDHREALQMNNLNEGALETRYLNEIGELSALPVMALSPAELMNMEIDSRGGYLLSMVDGHSSFQDLLELSPMDYLDSLRILSEFIAEGVLMVPSTTGPLSRRLRRDRGR